MKKKFLPFLALMTLLIIISPYQVKANDEEYNACVNRCNNSSSADKSSCLASCANLKEPEESASPEPEEEIIQDGKNTETCIRTICGGNVDGCDHSRVNACIIDLQNRQEVTPDTTVMCGTSLEIDQRLPRFVSNIYNLLKIATPFIMIIMGMLDFAKATVAQDADATNKAGKKYINRLVAGLAVFFVMQIVQFTADLLAKSGAGENVVPCMNCLLNNECGEK